MYDGQLELEYTCVSCHENTYPRRLAGGYCSDCIIGGMTPEELAAEDREHEQQRDDYRNRYLYDYARDVVNGKRTLKEAARSCYADLAEMEEAVEEIRREREEDDRAWREHLAYCAAERRAAHIHRALARGAAHKRKQEARREDERVLREIDHVLKRADAAYQQLALLLGIRPDQLESP